MIYDLKKILDIGEENGFAVPAFNVYNLETVMGVMQESKAEKALDALKGLSAPHARRPRHFPDVQPPV